MGAATAVETLGRTTRAGVERVGAAAAFVADTGRAAPDTRTWLPELMKQARRLGVDSVPIGMFIALFTGDSLVFALRGLVTDIRANPKKYLSVHIF